MFSSPLPVVARYLLGVALLAVAYYLTGMLGLMLPYAGQSITLIWPPTGIAVAVLLRRGLHFWPGIFVGALLINLRTSPVETAFAISIGNAAAPALAVYLLRKARFDHRFSRQRDVLVFLGCGALVGMLVSASNGVAWLWLDGTLLPGELSEAWLVWWLGDAIGVLALGTPLLTYSHRVLTDLLRPGRRLEIAFATLGALLFTMVVVGPWMPEFFRRYPVGMFTGILILLAAVRYGVWAGSVVALVIAGVAVGTTVAGLGAFHGAESHAGLISLWTYIVGLETVLLVLAAMTAERDRAETRLTASEATYRTLVEDNPAMIARLGPDGVVTFANATFGRAAAVPPLGRPFLEGSTADDRSKLASALATLTPGGPSATLELLAAGGRLRWHKWTLRAVGAPGRPPAGFQAIGLDVTDLRRAEADRRDIQDQMYQTQKLESLGMMAGGIAHDFNNILTGILGHAELAAEDLPMDDPVRFHLTRVSESARRAADLTRQLLAYAGKGKLLVQPLDLNVIIRDTADLVGVSIPKKVALRFETTKLLPLVSADETQIRQVLMNLIINAGEAIGDRPGTIRVATDATVLEEHDLTDSRMRSSVFPGRYVRLRVSDTGSGMTPEVQARIFDPFFTTKFTGRGLGLAAVQGIVRAHHGCLQVESVPERGTEFIVLFPALEDAPTQLSTSDPTPRPIPSPLPFLPTSERLVALVIDDEETVRNLARRMLESMGWQVLTAVNGRDGVEQLRRNPDVGFILLDLTMPVMDGLETLAAIRQLRADAPVILCTGYSTEAATNLNGEGPTGVLLKPFRLAEMKRIVTAVRTGTLVG